VTIEKRLQRALAYGTTMTRRWRIAQTEHDTLLEQFREMQFSHDAIVRQLNIDNAMLRRLLSHYSRPATTEEHP
jgi:hypothetical protein